jgi:diguanylate cyclase (GGDEF)-like protein
MATAEGVNPFRSLPARISLLVFGATLITSLFVTWISVQEVDGFLRGKIELKFPEVADTANISLNRWFDQQVLNLGVLAGSDVLRGNVDGLLPDAAETKGRQAARDVGGYLTYGLERFDHLDGLFVLRPDGETLAWVGSEFPLEQDVRKRLTASRSEPKPILIDTGDSFAQIVSLTIQAADGRDVGLLSAVIPLSVLAEVLPVSRLGDTGRILLIDEAGVYVAVGKHGHDVGLLAVHPRSAERPHTVIDYEKASGERVVSYAVPLSQYDLTLAVEERYTEAFAPLLAAFRRVVSINLAVVFLFGMLAFRVAATMVRPIEALSDATRRIAEDEAEVELPEHEAPDEVGVLTRTFSLMWSRLTSNALDLERSQAETEKAVQQMREKNAELQRANEVLEQLSITDGLTKLHNHRYFQEQLRREIRRADRVEDPLALVLIDIDHFKKWNDEFGHAGGDEILRGIAQVMNGLVRETDILARYGGEEFTLVLPKTDVEGAVHLAEKIRSGVAEAEFVEDLPADHMPLTVSIGVNVYGGDQRDLFEGADRALYRAKDSGRDCVMVAEGLPETV